MSGGSTIVFCHKLLPEDFRHAKVCITPGPQCVAEEILSDYVEYSDKGRFMLVLHIGGEKMTFDLKMSKQCRIKCKNTHT